MAAETQNYLTFLTLAGALVLIYGQVVRINGRAYLRQVYGESDVAGSMNRPVTVLFHFLVLTLIGLISTVDIAVGTHATPLVAKLGILILTLGLAHCVTLAGHAHLRDRQLARTNPDVSVAGTEHRGQYAARPHDPAHPQAAAREVARKQAVATRPAPNRRPSPAPA